MVDQKDKKAAPGVEFLPPTSQVDLERRLERDHLPEGVLVDNESDDARNPEVVNAPYATEDTDTTHYRGVSPEYMTHASDTEKPMQADEGAEAEALKRLSGGVADVRRTTDLRSEPVVEVGVTAGETVNTATSGEAYSAKLVDAPPDFQGRASDDVDYAGKPEATQSTVPVKAATPTKATKAAAPKQS
jgi:hypothetical protein